MYGLSKANLQKTRLGWCSFFDVLGVLSSSHRLIGASKLSVGVRASERECEWCQPVRQPRDELAARLRRSAPFS